MTLNGSPEGENGALKPYAQAKHLLVLGARALIDIGRVKLLVPERETGGILLFPCLSVK